MTSMYILIVVALAAGSAALASFFWAVGSGQFEDPEGPKYRMLDDNDERVRRSE